MKNNAACILQSALFLSGETHMIELQHLSKSFPVAGGTVDALKDISLTIPDGEIYGIIGMSGAGKSTLVRCINMLERPTTGKVIIDGKDIGALSQKQLRQERRNITMIFQGFNLLMQRNCLKNVCFPLELAGESKAQAVKRATKLFRFISITRLFKYFNFVEESERHLEDSAEYDWYLMMLTVTPEE